jgi:hypothetical protein
MAIEGAVLRITSRRLSEFAASADSERNEKAFEAKGTVTGGERGARTMIWASVLLESEAQV